jgi:hypothetical protein
MHIGSGFRRFSLACVTAAAFCVIAGSAQAATTVYPAGGSDFSGSAQGWQVTTATCTVPVLCTAEGGYDGTVGNPAGSVAARASIVLNLVGTIKATVTAESPAFKVTGAGTSTLHLDRMFDQGSLVDLAPQAQYSVALIDKTAGTQSTPIEEAVAGATTFAGEDAATSVKAGHTYALSITTTISSTVAATGLLAGSTSLYFDNVALSVQDDNGGTGGNGGGGNGSGGNGSSGGNLTDARLLSLINGSLIGPATLKRNKIMVRAKCPAKIGVPCRITLRGMLTKKKPATSSRKGKVAKGKTKKFVLRVKPKGLKKVKASKRLLFKEIVRAGSAKATVYKRLKLVRR